MRGTAQLTCVPVILVSQFASTSPLRQVRHSHRHSTVNPKWWGSEYRSSREHESAVRKAIFAFNRTLLWRCKYNVRILSAMRKTLGQVEVNALRSHHSPYLLIKILLISISFVLCLKIRNGELIRKFSFSNKNMSSPVTKKVFLVISAFISVGTLQELTASAITTPLDSAKQNPV